MSNPADDDLTPPPFTAGDPFGLPDLPGIAGEPLPSWLFDAQLPNDPRITTDWPAPVDLPDPLPESSHASPPTLTDAISLPLSYGLVAKINLPRTANGFRVEHRLPANVTLLETVPESKVVQDLVTWEFGRMPAGQDLKLRLVVQPSPDAKLRAGDLTSFAVTYTQNLSFQTPLVRPRITPKIDGPVSLEVGQSATYTLSLTNTGNWPVTSILAIVSLPKELQHAEGTELSHRIAQLLPGESQTLSMNLLARGTGNSAIQAAITTGENLREEIRYPVSLTSAQLKIIISGPDEWYVDERANVRVLVRNLGDAPARNLQILASLPETFRFNNSDGEFDPANNTVAWHLADIIPNGSRSFELQLTPDRPQDERLSVSAIADNTSTEAELLVPARLNLHGSSKILEDFLSASQVNLPKPTIRKATVPTRTGVQHIVFSVDQTDYAVPITNVLEVGRPPVWTPLPNVPDWLLGVTNVRGDIVSLVNLRTFFGQEDRPFGNDARMLVMRSKNLEITTGLVVDRVRGLRTLNPEKRSTPTAPITASVTPYIGGLTEYDGKLIVLLDVDLLLMSPAMTQFDKQQV